MKKNFYSMACFVFLIGLLTASCQKDNVKPASEGIKQGTSTSSSADGGAWTSTPEPPAAHPTCSHSAEH